MDNQQVSWFETLTFAERFAASHGLTLNDLPVAGTPRWCDMSDRDARKLVALVLGGVREALSHDIRQEAMANVSREISTMAKWSSVGRGRGPAYIRRTA
ncbi:DUF2742 domain-containing protein [Mycolicibacterium mengxianglii]|uniref:DUF2742 domain-containing protein n=1 Tax=Mycolicibacterium mengxianglii TaxID=2736649 RepID=UPI0018D0AEEB|nr:DUF2742 domain-containing protein [Mycolicibacterium mengxianglii]